MSTFDAVLAQYEKNKNNFLEFRHEILTDLMFSNKVYKKIPGKRDYRVHAHINPLKDLDIQFP